jgi:hypothetical protein
MFIILMPISGKVADLRRSCRKFNNDKIASVGGRKCRSHFE